MIDIHCALQPGVPQRGDCKGLIQDVVTCAHESHLVESFKQLTETVSSTSELTYRESCRHKAATRHSTLLGIRGSLWFACRDGRIPG